METTVPIAIALAAGFLLALGAVADDRRARIKRREAERVEPPLLHSINDDRCIGCEACVDVCPTKVLDIVNHIVRVARFSDCVQCEQCANACPTTALVMFRQGTIPRTLTVPELDDHFQTGVPGQYLIGEIAGKPLVKNAANLGRAVIEHISHDLAAQPRAANGVVDVVIVGSGPGGLSAGLTCIRKGLSCVVLDKEHVLASTVSRYPKGKHFMAEPSTAINLSYLPVFDGSKEELVNAWRQVVDGVKLPVKLGEAVETVKRGEDGVFAITTTVAVYRARTVVLATGLRGKPRLLAVPGANLEKVQSLLDDPAEFASEDVLVVGGGDSAVEGAMALADLGATVTLSYRGDGFKRCKQGNQKRLAEMIANGKLSVLLESNVQEFTDAAVSIKLKDGSVTTLPNHHAFVLIGADTPVAWLENNNVRFVEREHLYALGSTEDVVRKAVPDATECPRSADEALALVLGKAHRAPQRSSHHNGLRSVVGHIHDEFRDVVTSVTGIFKMPTADRPNATRVGQKTQTNLRALGRNTPAKGRPLISATSLTRERPPAPPPPKLFPVRRPPTVSNPFEPEETVQVPAFGQVARVGKQTNTQVAGPKVFPNTTVEMLSLPARLVARSLGETLARAAKSPFESDPSTIQTQALTDSTVETSGLRDDSPFLPEPATRIDARRHDKPVDDAKPAPRSTTSGTPPPKRARTATFGSPTGPTSQSSDGVGVGNQLQKTAIPVPPPPAPVRTPTTPPVPARIARGTATPPSTPPPVPGVAAQKPPLPSVPRAVPPPIPQRTASPSPQLVNLPRRKVGQ